MNGATAPFPGDLPSLSKPRLLLAEDNPPDNAFLCELLAAEYVVETTSNGEEAWSALERQLPDLILADILMPLLDGLGLARRLRADPRTASVPIILLTASHRKEMLQQGLEAGMDDFLLKPFHPLELLARLRCQRRLIAMRRAAIEEVARREAVLVESERKRFLASLSHELRTPLTPLPFILQMLGRRKELPAFVHEGLATIARGVDAETRLINDLVAYSEIVHGQLALDLEFLNLHVCLDAAIEDSGLGSGSEGLGLTVELQAESHHVMADPIRLRKVFDSLLRNAVKFTPQDGRVTVRSLNEGGCVVVEVVDNGLGFPAEMLTEIFRPFEHGTPQRERIYGGMGLGLTIAHAVVVAHQGELTAESSGTGQGSTFRLRLNTVSTAPPSL